MVVSWQILASPLLAPSMLGSQLSLISLDSGQRRSTNQNHESAAHGFSATVNVVHIHVCGMLVVVHVLLTFHLPLSVSLPLSLSLPSIPPLSLSQVHTFDLNALSPGT